MNVFSIAAIGVIGAIFAVFLKKYHPEYSMSVTLTAIVVIMVMVIGQLSPVVSKIAGLASDAGLPSEYGGILIKSLGICFVVQLASDACRDAGETALASNIEMAGKIGVVIIALPLFEKLGEIAIGLIK